jgi:hypothetical protein
MGCLFCYDPEPEYKLGTRYKPLAGFGFVCSWCVQLLLAADQQDLKRAHAKAIQKGFTNKASAIESFLIPEDKIDGQRKPAKKRRRNFDRKRIVRTVRDKAKRIGRSKI